MSVVSRAGGADGLADAATLTRRNGVRGCSPAGGIGGGSGGGDELPLRPAAALPPSTALRPPAAPSVPCSVNMVAAR